VDSDSDSDTDTDTDTDTDSDTDTDTDSDTDTCNPNNEPTWNDPVNQIMQDHCVQCHSQAGDYNSIQSWVSAGTLSSYCTPQHYLQEQVDQDACVRWCDINQPEADCDVQAYGVSGRSLCLTKSHRRPGKSPCGYSNPAL
jgi:hypothetical protein